MEAAQHMETAAKLMVRAKQYDRAAEALHTTLGLYSEAGGGMAAGRVVLSFILVQVRVLIMVSNATGFLVGANLRIFRATKINCAQFRIFRIFRITSFAPKFAQ